MIFLRMRNWFPFQGRFPRARLQLIFFARAVPAGVAPPLQPIYKVIKFLIRRFAISKENYNYVPTSFFC